TSRLESELESRLQPADAALPSRSAMAERLLDAVEVRSPCLMSWNAMAGDERVRHCSHCRQNVYNLSEMSRREAELLLKEHEGHVCVRYYRRSDGTVVTGDCQSKVSSLVRRRIALTVALVLSLLTGLFGVALYSQSQGTRLGRVRHMLPRPIHD